MATEEKPDRFALGAVVAGAAALVFFAIAPFTSEAFWPIGLVLAVAGGVVGWLALRRTSPGARSRTMALVGLVASVIVIVWFLVYLIVSALN
ncbi:MAG: hypothetical protein ABR521_02055 [Gaiellaceae bacterium]